MACIYKKKENIFISFINYLLILEWQTSCAKLNAKRLRKQSHFACNVCWFVCVLECSLQWGLQTETQAPSVASRIWNLPNYLLLRITTKDNVFLHTVIISSMLSQYWHQHLSVLPQMKYDFI